MPNRIDTPARRTRAPRSAMRCLLGLVALAAPLSPLPQAAAQPTSTGDAIARAHFTAATGYFDTGDYESALREFERAYALTRYPGLLYNLYLCNERLGLFAQAAERLAQYLAESPNLDNRADLEARLANLRRRLEARPTAADPPTGDAPPPTTPSAGTDAPPTEEPATAEPEDAAPSNGPSRVGPLVALSVGGSGVITFVTAAFLARSENDRLARSCGSEADGSCTDAEVAGLRRRTLTADVGLGVGVAAGVAGLVWWLVQGDETAAPVVTADRDGATLSFVGRF